MMADEFNVREAGQKRARWEAVADLDLGGNGATADFSLWNPDAPPITPSAVDVEFNQVSALPAGWSEYDPGGVQSVSFDERGVVLAQPASHLGVTGIYRAIPAGGVDTTMTALCAGANIIVANPEAGIAFWEDATDPTKKIIIFGEGWADQVVITSFPNGTSQSDSVVDVVVSVFAGYLRVRRNGTTATLDLSAKGLGFTTISSGNASQNMREVTIPFTPQHFGVAFFSQNCPFDSIAVLKYFRYKDSDVGIAAKFEGARVKGFYV